MQESHSALDAVAKYLASRGVSRRGQRAGLHGLIARWEAFAHAAERYDLTLDAWRDDVDLRDIIAGALAVAPDADRAEAGMALGRADAFFREATVETKRSLWGDSVGSADEHDPRQQWWYYRRPKDPGETMLASLKGAGIE